MPRGWLLCEIFLLTFGAKVLRWAAWLRLPIPSHSHPQVCPRSLKIASLMRILQCPLSSQGLLIHLGCLGMDMEEFKAEMTWVTACLTCGPGSWRQTRKI